jgi:hypothetical protein
MSATVAYSISIRACLQSVALVLSENLAFSTHSVEVLWLKLSAQLFVLAIANAPYKVKHVTASRGGQETVLRGE